MNRVLLVFVYQNLMVHFCMCMDYHKESCVNKTDTFPIPLLMTALITLDKPNMLRNLICLKDFGKYLWQTENRKSEHLLLQMAFFSIKLCCLEWRNPQEHFNAWLTPWYLNWLVVKPIATTLLSSVKNGNGTYKLSEISQTDLVRLN